VKPTVDVPDLPPVHNLAINAAFTWVRAAMEQATRLLQGASYWEAYVLLLSLRQVLRAAEMAQGSSFQSRRARQILNTAVRRFKADLPDLVDARDIIEHFDKYAVGKGDLQLADRDADPSLTDAQLVKRYEARLEGPWGEPILRVGSRALEITKVIEACDTLFKRMFAAAEAEDEHAGPPT
jgi:hypothetical protein